MPSGYYVTQDAPFGIENLVAINDTIYVKREQDFQPFLDRITELGYDHKLAESSTDPDKLYASLSDRVSMAKCGHCHQYISIRGIHRSAGCWCDKCGKLINWEMTEASTIEISVHQTDPDDSRYRYFDTIRFTVLAFDHETDTLYLSPKVLPSRWARTKERMTQERNEGQALLEKHAALFPIVDLDFRQKVGPDLKKVKRPKAIPAIAIKYNSTRSLNKDDAEPDWYVSNFQSQKLYRKVQQVLVFQGQEYDGDMFSVGKRKHPFPSSFFIVKAWKHFPVSPHPSLYTDIMLAAGMSLNLQDYLVRDGGWDPSRFAADHFPMTREFVDQFTSLNVDEWDRFINAHKDLHAAKLIIEMAKLCHPEPVLYWKWNQGLGDYAKTTVENAKKQYQSIVRPDTLRSGKGHDNLFRKMVLRSGMSVEEAHLRMGFLKDDYLD